MRFIQKFVFFVFLVSGSVSKAEVYDVSTTAELREALASAAAAGGDNTIRLAAGTYSTQDDGEGTFEFIGTRESTLVIKGAGADKTFLDGASIDTILSIRYVNGLRELLVEDILFRNSTMDVDQNGNTGGLFAEVPIDAMTIANCRFLNNESSALRVTFNEADRNDPTVTVINSEFSDNSAYASGGAIRAYVGVPLVIRDSSFTGNQTRTELGDSYGGGAVAGYVKELTNSTFDGNFSASAGGAVRNYALYIRGDEAYRNISRNIFKNNSASQDGAIHVRGQHYLQLSQNRFENNSSTGSSTDVFLDPNMLGTRLTNNVFHSVTNSETENIRGKARFSNNLFVNSRFVLWTRSTFANNTFLGDYSFNEISDAIHSFDNNYLDEEKLSDLVFVGEENIFSEIALGFVNAEQGDYRLTSSSGLIDAGTTDPELAYITDYDYTGTTDRVIGASVDIGPYEYDGEAPPDSDGDGLNDNIDNCPSVANEDQADFDSDGEGDVCDSDDDNDGTNDEDDAFPFDDTESLDTDGDGIGNNEDYDDDADGILDSFDNAPLVANAIAVDSDNDGVIDSVDAYPNDPTKQYSGSDDLDGDGWSNDDEVDYCTNPFDKNSQPDVGGLSVWMLYLGTQPQDTQ